MIEQIKNYYENYDEDNRLFRDRSRLTEYLTTIRYFDKLIAPNSEILDVCAGTGRYSFFLADKGHIVTACDLVESNVEKIKKNINAHKLNEVDVCNVINLERFKNNCFDVVLCMGALYHLATKEERMQAVSECVRVCKKGGILVFAYITKIGAIVVGLQKDFTSIESFLKILDDTDEGIFRCIYPSEIQELSDKFGLQKICNIGTDGMSQSMSENINLLNDKSFNVYMDYIYRTCEDESILGTSLHALYFARKT